MATAIPENELRQQGAIEAARDPHSSVTADDAQEKMLAESKRAGVFAINLDTNATAQERLAQARAAVPDGFHNQNRTHGISVVTDLDQASVAPSEDLPAASNAGVIDVPKDKDGKPITDGEDPVEAEKEPPYQRTGWAPQFGWPYDDIQEADSLLDHSTFLESRLPDHLYGDWYHNAGVIIFACIASWLVAVLGGGLGWVFLVMAVCATYYRTSIRRVRRNFRDDITREVSLRRLETDHETVEWINSFLLKFWPIYQPVLAQTIINSVDQVLSSSTPAFLDSLKLKTFTLGSKPPRMEYVKTLKAEDDILIMDWSFSFTPNDTADMTAKQIRNKINPKVVLEIRVGKAMISKGLDVILEDMALSGTMRLKIKLQIPFPHIDRIELSFLDRPVIDYVCKPLGGDTFGFDINFIPGLERFILDQIHGTLAPMMYAPNVFPVEVAKLLAGTPVDQAVGVVALTLHGAQGLKNTDNFGTVDPYAVVSLNRRQPLARTRVVKDSNNPRWNETHYIIVTSFNDSLDVEIIDHNGFRKSKSLGVCSFALEHLEELSVYENERLEVVSDGKARGVVSCDVRFFPVLEGKTLPDGKVEPPPNTNQGILRFTVEQAKDLDGTKSLVGLLNPYADLLLNGRIVHSTKKLKRTNNPIWDNGFKEMLIQDRKHAKLGVAIKDDRDLAGDQHLGAKQIRLDDLLRNMEEGKEWYYLDGPNSGRVKMMAQWKPVAVSGVVGGTGGYVTPIGVMRLHFIRAVDLRNFETMGKSDPYVRVLLSGIEKGRTVTFKNNLNPEWDEVLYIPVHSARENLTLEVMDSEKVGKDRGLGATELNGADFIRQLENGEYLVHEDKIVRDEGLRLHGKGTTKGTLVFTAAFYPCLNIADPEEEEGEGEGEKGEEEEEKEGGKERGKEGRERKANEESDKISGSSTSSLKEPSGSSENGDAPKSPASTAFTPVSPAGAGASIGVERTNTEKSLAPRSPTIPPPSPSSPRKSRELEQRGPPVVHLSPQELLKYESGLVLVRLIEAELPRANTQIELWVDDMGWPSYVSSISKTRTRKFEEIGDCFVRELEWSHLTLKIREKGEKQDDDKDHTLAYLSGDTLATLKQCLNNPTTLKLKMKDEDDKPSTVKISLKYLPIKMELHPSESISNMGNLRVEVLDAQDLPAADSNGKSDPFCKFELNGIEVFKTKVQKKTLNPSWNEFFEVAVRSRTAAKFKVEVWDWDLASNADFLGQAWIDIRDLVPFGRSEKKLALQGEKGSAGNVRLRLLFTPDYIRRTRQGTSSFAGTFSGPSRIVSGVTSAPSKFSQGVGKSTSFLKRGLRGRREDSNGSLAAAAAAAAATDLPPSALPRDGPAGGSGGTTDVPVIGLRRPTNPASMDAVALPALVEPAARPASSPHGSQNGAAPNHVRKKSFGAASTHSNYGGAQAGTATFTVVQAADFPVSADLFVSINQQLPKVKSVGKTKAVKSAGGTVRFDETFKFTCTPDAQFMVSVRGKHTFKGDDEYGDTLYFVDDAGSGGDREVRVGTGTVIMRSSFVPNAEAGEFPDSPRSTFRRSLLPKRDGKSSRETTPVLQ